MNDPNPQRDHLDLDALFPEMSASFSARVDDALDAIRRDRSYYRKRINKNRGVLAACACAAAFVLCIGAALVSPLLRSEHPIVAMDTPVGENIVLMTAEPTSTVVPPQKPTPTPQPTVAPTPLPTPTPTPHTTSVHTAPARSIEEATPYQIESSVVSLIELVHLSVAHRTVMDMSGIMEVTPETKQFLADFERAIAALPEEQVENPDRLPAITRFEQQWGDTVNDTLFVDCSAEWTYGDDAYSVSLTLGFAMRQDGLYIVSIEADGEPLRHLLPAIETDGEGLNPQLIAAETEPKA